jgi:hypothetical protein
MRKKTNSILEEMFKLAPSRDSNLLMEARGVNIIESAIAFLEGISDEYGIEFAADLEKRMMSSIRNRNNGKFIRAVRGIVIENKKS